MKKIGFIGAFEKTDLILYIAKILVEIGKKILVIDTTTLQRARYIVPCISPSLSYITEYEGIDVAVGFQNYERIIQYAGTPELEYDIILIDVDSEENFSKFDMKTADKNYFITAFDNYSLKKGLEIIGQMQDKVVMTKILFSRDILQEDDDYLNFLSFYFPVIWDDEIIYFPYETGDNTVIIQNQRISRIVFKDLSQQYKDSLSLIAEEILPDIKSGDWKKAYKRLS